MAWQELFVSDDRGDLPSIAFFHPEPMSSCFPLQ
jgi:hypothetical protein